MSSKRKGQRNLIWTEAMDKIVMVSANKHKPFAARHGKKDEQWKQVAMECVAHHAFAPAIAQGHSITLAKVIFSFIEVYHLKMTKLRSLVDSDTCGEHVLCC